MSNNPVWKWQPIATAPHDQPVFVFSARWGAIIATFRSDFNAWFSRMQCPASLNDTDSEALTHWMPLPQAPEMSPRQPAARPALGPLPGLTRSQEFPTTRVAA